MTGTLLALLLLFGGLSLVSFGGGNAVLGAMQRQAVDRHHWLSDTAFLDLFALSRAAPGPGSLIAALIGQRAAGIAGALVATVGMTVPSSLLVYLTSAWARRHPASPARLALERALAPVAIGLTIGSAVAVARHDEHGLGFGAITLVSTVVLSATRLNPLLVLGGCAAAAALI